MDVVDDPVALVLAVEDLGRELLVVRIIAKQAVEQLGGLLDVLASFLEELEVDAVARSEDLADARHGPIIWMFVWRVAHVR